MKKIVLTFGLLAGSIFAAEMALMAVFLRNGAKSFDRAEIVGYTVMLLAFLLVFFGIRSYRENEGAGAITFGKGFQVGILIALIASAVYVASWEVVYYNFLPDFADKYAAHTIEKMRAKGESAEAIEATTRQMKQFREMYKNPFVNSGMTFLEVFPVGLVVALVSAGILRKRRPAAA